MSINQRFPEICASDAYKEACMKNRINWLGPQSLRFYVIALAAIIVFSLACCEEGFSSGNNSHFTFDSESGTIIGYDDGGPKNVTIPSAINDIKVTAIGKNAFRGKRLTSVSILTGITTIGEGAFADNQLETITIPNSVINIGDKTFEYNRLTNVTIGSSVVSIGKEAFAVNQLNSINIPNNVSSILEDAFSGNSLTSVTIGPNKNYASNIVPNFGTVYNGNGKEAGTYTRVDSNTWTKQ